MGKKQILILSDEASRGGHPPACSKDIDALPSSQVRMPLLPLFDLHFAQAVQDAAIVRVGPRGDAALAQFGQLGFNCISSEMRASTCEMCASNSSLMGPHPVR